MSFYHNKCDVTIFDKIYERERERERERLKEMRKHWMKFEPPCKICITTVLKRFQFDQK